MAAPEDQELLGQKSRPTPKLQVTDKSLRSFEYLASSSLGALSSFDVMLAALTTAFTERVVPLVSDQVVQDDLRALLSGMSDVTQRCADSVASIYQNAVLLRRDVLLASATIPEAAKAAARSVPIKQPFLLGPAAHKVIKDAAKQASGVLALEASVAASKARRPPASGFPSDRKKPRPAFTRRSSGWSSSRRRFDRSQGKPPQSDSRRQQPRASPKGKQAQ